jgi:hypothetical protein
MVNLSDITRSFKQFILKNLTYLLFVSFFILLWDSRFGVSFYGYFSVPVFLFIMLLVLFLVQFVKFNDYAIRSDHSIPIMFFSFLSIYCIGIFEKSFFLFDSMKSITDITVFYIVLIVTLILGLVSIIIKSKLMCIAFFSFSILFNIVCIITCKDPGIDTYAFISMASDYLLSFKNPYVFTYPDYYKGLFAHLYGNTYYFNYWPFILYIVTPFKYFFGDVRYGLLFCNILFLLIIIWKRKLFNLSFYNASRLGSLWLLNPLLIYIILKCWVDAIVPLFILLIIVNLKERKLLFFSITVGLLASIKLYFIFMTPFAVLYLWKERISKKLFIKYIIIMGFSFLLPMIPFLICSPMEFFKSTIVFFMDSKVRYDSLSIIATLNNLKVDINIFSNKIILVFLTLMLFLYNKLNKSISNFIKVLFIFYYFMFLFAKQSFAYYFLVNFTLIFLLLTINDKLYESRKQ